MKKIISLAAALSMIFGAASCQKENLAGKEGDATVRFSVEIPNEVTKVGQISDGNMIDMLRYEVYLHGTNTKVDELTKTYPIGTRKFEVEMTLVSEIEYDILFWAGSTKAPYTLDGYYHSLKNVGIGYVNAKANDETRDAFCGKLEKYEILKDITTSKTVYLSRPFAQVNFASSALDWERAQPFVSTANGQVGLQTKVYFSKLAANYNVLTGESSGEVNGITFGYAQAPVLWSYKDYASGQKIWYQDQSWARLAMNYVLPVSSESGVIPEVKGYFQHNMNTGDGEALERVVHNVPVKQNYRTNILGDIFTGGNKFTVIIDSDFENEYNEDPDYNVASPLKYALSNGGTYKLDKDITIDESLYVGEGKDVVLDLNGKTLTYTKNDILFRTNNNSQLTIKGNGTINAAGYVASVNANGRVIVENGTFVTTDATIFQSNGGTVIINGGSYKAEPYQGTYYTLNLVDGVANAAIEVSGGKFYMYDPANSSTEPNGPVSFLKDGYQSVADAAGEWYEVTQK